jgi:O-methyltransferase involved in polyketide biosynthesis
VAEQERAPKGIDPAIPSVARMYDFYLGGKDNFASDREAGQKVMAAVPGVRETTRANRVFLGAAVRTLAERGVRQFLDIGAGLPTQENVHQVALRAAPDSRIVYVDNDPIVLTHAQALLAGNPRTTVVEGDLREPGAILDQPAVRAHIDFTQPVAILLLAILHFIPGHEETAGIVETLRARMAPGSHLVLSHFYSPDADQSTVRAGQEVYSTTTAGSLTARSYQQISDYFAGLDLLDPGLVPVHAWLPHRLPHHARDDDADEVTIDLTVPGLLGAVGRVPLSREHRSARIEEVRTA